MALDTGDTRSGGQVSDADGYEKIRLASGNLAGTWDAPTLAGVAKPFAYAAIAATADGATALVAAPGASLKIRVVAFVLTTTAAGVVEFRSATTVKASIRSGADGGGAALAGSPDCPLFECAANEALNIFNPNDVDSYGMVTYVVLPSSA